MKIAVLGTGVVAQTIAEKLAAIGNLVMIGTRDVSAALSKTAPDNFGRPGFKDWHAKHAGIRLGTYRDAAAFAALIINATNGGGTLDALALAGKENLNGKTLLDIANPLDFSKGAPPSLFVCNTDSLGEQVQRAFPEARVVKSLNTMTAFLMVNPALISEDHHVFLSGNDAGAKQEVRALLKSMGWKENNMIDLGDISTARGTEQLLPVWVRLWGTLKNPIFNFKVVIGRAPSQ